MPKRCSTCGLLALTLCLSAGCWNSGRPEERFGKTYYLDGAGNFGFGMGSVREGLVAAGYRGDVEVFVWTTSFNPLLDQRNTVLNDIRAGQLAGKIEHYLKNYPDNDVNVIALSAGTGVAMWAVEKLHSPDKINNLVLLGSSLWSQYDVTKALANMKGKIYVYYSAYDDVLDTFVRRVGTVDNRFGVDSAGLVGLHPDGQDNPRVVNIGYRPSYDRYGWAGDHTGATSAPFVRTYVAQHVVAPRAPEVRRRPASAARPTPAMREAPRATPPVQVVFVPDGPLTTDAGKRVQEGLARAGFDGMLVVQEWQPAEAPTTDDRSQELAAEGSRLCARLESLARRYSAGPINVLAAGQGTAVAVFAIERLDALSPVHNLVLVGSGLSRDYDLRGALINLTGNIYVYYSEQDQELIKAIDAHGTLDGQHGVASGGITGHVGPSAHAPRVTNVEWDSRYEADGWDGQYASCLNPNFVERQLAKHLLPSPPASPHDQASIDEGRPVAGAASTR
jgi:hypothetical protein